MIQWDDTLNRQYRTAFFSAIVLYVISPVVYLIIAQIMLQTPHQGGEVEMLFYILLILALVQPAAVTFIEKFQISMFKKTYDKSEVEETVSAPKSFKEFITAPGLDKARTGTPMGLFTTLTIVKAAFVEAIYLYGMVVYFISGDFIYLLYFYPIGILWTLVYFPRKSQYESLVERLDTHAAIN